VEDINYVKLKNLTFTERFSQNVFVPDFSISFHL